MASTHYLDPDATGANDGTSWTDAWTSLFNAEAGLDVDYAGGGVKTLNVRASGSTADTTATNFGGGTNQDATNYLHINVHANDPHLGAWNAAVYRLSVNGTPLTLADPFIRVEGMQIESTHTGSRNCVVCASGSNMGLIRKAILRNNNAGTTDRALSTNVSNQDIQIDTSLIYDIAGSSSQGVSQLKSTTSDLHVYRNTIDNVEGTGVANVASSTTAGVKAKGNLITNSGVDVSTTTFMDGTGYNGTDAASLPYTADESANDVFNLDATGPGVYTEESTEDYSLASGGGGEGVGDGTRTGALYAITEDILGNPIADGTEDIGCFERVQVSGFVPYPNPRYGMAGGHQAMSGGMQ